MVYVFREREKQWNGPYTVSKVSGKEVYVKDNGKEQNFIISRILPDKGNIMNMNF